MGFTKDRLLYIIRVLNMRKCDVEAKAVKYMDMRGDRTDKTKIAWLDKLLTDCEHEIIMIEASIADTKVMLDQIVREDKP